MKFLNKIDGANKVIQDAENRFVSDVEKQTWNGKADTEDLHEHTNKSWLDTITETLINNWNSAVTHISDAVKHITSAERTLWNTVSDKADAVHNHTISNITDMPAIPDKTSDLTNDSGYITSPDGGDASTVNGHTVESDVPSGAKFTDTVYTHPSTHPYSMITGAPTSLPASGGHALSATHLLGDDTRTVNSPPSVYMNGGDRYAGRAGWQTEFKTRTAIDSPPLSGTYVYLQTHTPWSDPSGGYPIQVAYGNGIPCWRVGVSTSAWSAWQKVSDGGNANTVNGFTIGVNVPSNAKFTDTVYSHPSSHPASIITESTTKRFVSDAEKTLWNSKSEFSGNYNDLSNKPIIPSTTSQLTNNSGYITINDIPDIPPSIQVGGVKPTDGSMWYEVI